MRLVPLVLLVVVGAMFLATVRYGFTNYDEQQQLVDNPLVQSLAPGDVARMFTRFSLTSYYPVRLLSYAFDYAIWKLDPAGYHLTNVLLHAANVLLVFALILRVLGGPRGGVILPAALGATLFAVHPVVVEPVAWVAGREELLMVFFGLLCVHAHASTVGSGRRRVAWHVVSAAALACACMSNAVAAILPAMVIAFDLVVARQRRVGKIAAGSWFLFLIAAGTIVVKVISDHVSGAGGGLEETVSLGPTQRLLTVLYTYGANLQTVVWPHPLIIIYDRFVPTGFATPGVLFGLLAAVLTVLVLWWARRVPAALFGLLWFVLALAPTGQVIPHHVYRADRFLYLPLVGLAVAASALLAWLWTRRRARVAAMVVASVLLVGCMVRSAIQIPVWRDTVSLFTYCLQYNPDAPAAFNALGLAYDAKGEHHRAIDEYTKAIESDPGFTKALTNRGNAYLAIGAVDQAVADLTEVVRHRPGSARAHFNRGNAYLRARDFEHGVADYNEAIALNPKYARAYSNRGALFFMMGRYEDAIVDYTHALALAPTLAEAYAGRGEAASRLGRFDDAIADLTRAIELRPADAGAFLERGNVYGEIGAFDKARRDWERAIAIDGTGAIASQARRNLTVVDQLE
jgi:tetratricopeptide (TPR) repeat protein